MRRNAQLLRRRFNKIKRRLSKIISDENLLISDKKLLISLIIFAVCIIHKYRRLQRCVFLPFFKQNNVFYMMGMREHIHRLYLFYIILLGHHH